MSFLPCEGGSTTSIHPFPLDLLHYVSIKLSHKCKLGLESPSVLKIDERERKRKDIFLKDVINLNDIKCPNEYCN